MCDQLFKNIHYVISPNAMGRRQNMPCQKKNIFEVNQSSAEISMSFVCSVIVILTEMLWAIHLKKMNKFFLQYNKILNHLNSKLTA